MPTPGTAFGEVHGLEFGLRYPIILFVLSIDLPVIVCSRRTDKNAEEKGLNEHSSAPGTSVDLGFFYSIVLFGLIICQQMG